MRGPGCGAGGRQRLIEGVDRTEAAVLRSRRAQGRPNRITSLNVSRAKPDGELWAWRAHFFPQQLLSGAEWGVMGLEGPFLPSATLEQCRVGSYAAPGGDRAERRGPPH